MARGEQSPDAAISACTLSSKDDDRLPAAPSVRGGAWMTAVSGTTVSAAMLDVASWVAHVVMLSAAANIAMGACDTLPVRAVPASIVGPDSCATAVVPVPEAALACTSAPSVAKEAA